jgi:hypothetical protein
MVRSSPVATVWLSGKKTANRTGPSCPFSAVTTGHFHHVQRAGAVEACLERLAGDILHDQVGQAVVLVDAVDGDDMVVADRSRGLRLAREAPPGCGAASHRCGHDLDRHQPVQGRVERLEDDAHAALADHLLHLVGAQGAEEFGPVGGAKEVQIGGVGGSAERRRGVVQPLHDLAKGRVEGRPR